MSGTYDTFESSPDETTGGDHSASCCCCHGALSGGSYVAEETYVDYAETAYTYPEPAAEEVIPAVTATAGYDPVSPGPVYVELVDEEPMYGGQGLVSASPSFVEPATAEVLAPHTATSSASGPGVEDGATPTFATIGGTNPYGGITIVDPSGNVVDPAAMAPDQAVIGGANAFNDASAAVAADSARFAQLSPAEMMAEVFGGSPETWENTPRISLHPTEGESVNDTLIRGMVTRQTLEAHAKEMRNLDDTMSPTYEPGDDMDPNSPYYRHRP